MSRSDDEASSEHEPEPIPDVFEIDPPADQKRDSIIITQFDAPDDMEISASPAYESPRHSGDSASTVHTDQSGGQPVEVGNSPGVRRLSVKVRLQNVTFLLAIIMCSCTSC